MRAGPHQPASNRSTQTRVNSHHCGSVTPNTSLSLPLSSREFFGHLASGVYSAVAMRFAFHRLAPEALGLSKHFIVAVLSSSFLI